MIAETTNDHRDKISSASLMVVLSMVIRTNLKNLETKSRKSKTCCVPLSCCLVHRRGKETWRHFSFVLFGVRGGIIIHLHLGNTKRDPWALRSCSRGLRRQTGRQRWKSPDDDKIVRDDEEETMRKWTQPSQVIPSLITISIILFIWKGTSMPRFSISSLVKAQLLARPSNSIVTWKWTLSRFQSQGHKSWIMIAGVS